ncbi:MAG: glycosyltransferase [Candidatus Nanopelagicales bacterium]|nr:glycosyltransferase [Candidatus Nanopelagicales bacterium]
MRRAVSVGALAAVGIAVHTAINLRYLRVPIATTAKVTERVSVLIPARNEAEHIAVTVKSILAQQGLDDLEVIVLDDGSTDGTAAIVQDITDPRLKLIVGTDEPPTGWLGKPWACARLADFATGSVLVFVDADVYFEPEAIRGTVELLRAQGFALVSPYPKQCAETWLERLVQPLIVWSWSATMPLRWAETSTRPSLSAANGQFIAIAAEVYRAIGGHEAVAGEVIEDVALMRAVKATGQRAATADGSKIANCRMYATPKAVVDGYTKSLWSAFSGPAGSIAVNALLLTTYVAPAAAMIIGRRNTRAIGAIGYAAGVASRVLVANRTGERIWPDALAHPISIAAFSTLNALSWSRHLRGTNTWKGRPVTAVN